ncbi:AMP-binding protein [Kangsaoukella pontilimi]|nr:hypothetical protein [Kangsaoukella pontilimi]
MSSTQVDRSQLSSLSPSLANGDAERLASPKNFALGREHSDRLLRHLILDDIQSSGGKGPLWFQAAKALFRPDGGASDAKDVVIGEDGVGLDSLARLSAASAVSRFFDLGSAGLDDYLLLEPSLDGWCGLVLKRLKEASGSPVLVFQTSGSTDSPKMVTKPVSEMFIEGTALGSVGVMREVKRIVSLAAPTHVFGFIFSVIMAEIRTVPVIDCALRSPISVMKGLRPGDVLVATPFQWKFLMETGVSFPNGVGGVSSGAALPEQTWNDCSNAGLATMTEVFGSTETGGLGYRTAPDSPFAFLPHLDVSAETLSYAGSGVPVPLQDELERIGEDGFTPKGRLDHAVQVAGVNVSLSRVADTLRQCDLVADAAVRVSGARLKAYVVPADPLMPDEQIMSALHAHATRLLEPVARPIAFSIGAKLPLNEMGKLSDW